MAHKSKQRVKLLNEFAELAAEVMSSDELRARTAILRRRAVASRKKKRGKQEKLRLGRRNAVSEVLMEKAVDLHESFTGEEHDSTKKVVISLPGPGEPLVDLGPCWGVVYLSNKEGYGDDQQYIHEFEDPLPRLASTTDRKTMFIIGGKWKIAGEPISWLHD